MIDTPPTSSCDLSRLSFWERLQVTLSGRCNTTTPPPPPTPPTPTYSISGTVFNDLNGNHVRDTGEPGTKGTQTSISLYRNANDSIPIGGLSVQAQTNGTYTVGSVPAGSYYIRGQTSPPYILTYPSNAQHYRTVSANIANLNFGIALSSCPTGFILQGSSCVAEVPTTCPALCNGSNLVNSCTGALVQSCSYGCTLNTNACNAPPPPPSVVTWSVLPLLVKSGKSAHVTWDTTNTVSCTVRGTNGDGTGNNSTGLWNSTSGSAATSPILSQTIYTLSCQGRLGSSPSTITRSTTVNIVPIFNEQ